MPFYEAEDQFAVDRNRNPNDAAEGTSLPPQQWGPGRVPLANSFRVIRTLPIIGGTEFTLSWMAPENVKAAISHYNIYLQGLLDNNQKLGPLVAQSSPAIFRQESDKIAPVTFFIQTQLKNGYVSDLELSPTCTAQMTNSVYTGNIVGTGVPHIVACAKLIGKVANIPITNLHTSVAGGMYRLNAYTTVTTIGAGVLNVFANWTDGVARNLAVTVQGMNAQSFSSSSIVMNVLPASNITYNTTMVGAAGGEVYDVILFLERIE